MKNVVSREIIKRGAYDRFYIQDCIFITDNKFCICVKNGNRFSITGNVLAFGVRQYGLRQKLWLLGQCFRWIFLRTDAAMEQSK